MGHRPAVRHTTSAPRTRDPGCCSQGQLCGKKWFTTNFLWNTLHLSNIFGNWLVASSVYIFHSQQDVGEVHVNKNNPWSTRRPWQWVAGASLCSGWCWSSFLSFGPELKNGSPLSRDNLLAAPALTKQLWIINNNNIIISCSDDLVDNNDDLQTFRLNGKHNLIMMAGHLKVDLNIVDSELQI